MNVHERAAVADLRQPLLAPRSIALVGQSDDPAKTAGRPLKYLRQAGYAGVIYPVNARRKTVLGERCWQSVASLPEVPDHAYILAPTEAAIDAAEACGLLGIPVATILADGFAEGAPGGVARKTRLEAICARTGMRIVGPSSLGVVNLREKVLLTASAAFAEKGLPAGRIFAASHSGSIIGALVSRGKTRGIGFAGLVSVGTEVDLSIGEICAATLDDPDIDGYMLFLESLRKADALRAFALGAAERGKPVIAYKLGRSAEARELAVSHTGALVGEDDVADVFLAACGIARVDTFEGLLEALPLVAKVQPSATRSRRSVGVVTTTAGGATMVVDRLATSGVAVSRPSDETFGRLAAAGIEALPARLVDLTTAGTRPEIMTGALDILLAAPEFDLILAVVGSSARFHPELAVQPIIDSAVQGAPLAVFLVPEAPEALARLADAGIACFRTPEAAADAIAAALSRRVPNLPAVMFGTNPRGPGRMLDEFEAGAILDRIGIRRAPGMALPANITHAPALPFAYPVAVKALSRDIAHKSDVGGVELGVRDASGVIGAVRRIRDRVAKHRHGTRVDRVLIQPMMTGLGEALVGYRVDADVGPIVMVAAGGLFTELYRDRSLRLAPIDLATARAMIAEVHGLTVLAGYRGRPAGDIEALARAVVAMSQLAGSPDIAEAEINPLIVRVAGEGVVAVDALVKLV